MATYNDGVKSKALLAAVELERRKHESCKRLDQLEEEQRALEEIRDALVSEERDLSQRLAIAREKRDNLAGKIDTMTRRTMEVGGKTEETKQEVAVLNRRLSENTEREQEMRGEIASVEKVLVAARNEIFHATDALETGRAALSRMDRKLSLNRLKR